MIKTFLADAYWAKTRPASVIEKSIENSLCFGIYINSEQAGFARVITDYATFAYIVDVFILKDYRGKGYSKKLIRYILNYPELKLVRRWMLATEDAQDLYSKMGFVLLKNPERYMQLIREYDNIV